MRTAHLRIVRSEDSYPASYASTAEARQHAPDAPPNHCGHKPLQWGCGRCYARAKYWWQCACGDWRDRRNGFSCHSCGDTPPEART